MTLDPLELARLFVSTIADKKGEDVLLLDLRGVSAFTDYFVIGSGTSERQIRALLDAIRETAKAQHHRRASSVEGRAEAGWVLADYGDVIVHLFSPDKRAYYDLEGLWREGKVVVRIQ